MSLEVHYFSLEIFLRNKNNGTKSQWGNYIEIYLAARMVYHRGQGQGKEKMKNKEKVKIKIQKLGMTSWVTC